MWRSGCAMVLSSLALTACQTTGGGCPPLVAYSADQLAKAGSEYEALPADSELARMIVDYGKTRDACRVVNEH